jgi:WD40 repeat protein
VGGSEPDEVRGSARGGVAAGGKAVETVMYVRERNCASMLLNPSMSFDVQRLCAALPRVRSTQAEKRKFDENGLVELECSDGHIVSVNKAACAHVSQLFMHMFNPGSRFQPRNRLSLEQATAANVRAVLHLALEDTYPQLNAEAVPDIWIVADYLQFTESVRERVRNALNTIAIEMLQDEADKGGSLTCIVWLEKCIGVDQLKGLHELCMNRILWYPQNIFEHFTLDFAADLLQNDNLEVNNELEALKLVLDWWKKINGENKEELSFKKIVQNVRFPRMTKRQLVEALALTRAQPTMKIVVQDFVNEAHEWQAYEDDEEEDRIPLKNKRTVERTNEHIISFRWPELFRNLRTISPNSQIINQLAVDGSNVYWAGERGVETINLKNMKYVRPEDSWSHLNEDLMKRRTILLTVHLDRVFVVRDVDDKNVCVLPKPHTQPTFSFLTSGIQSSIVSLAICKDYVVAGHENDAMSVWNALSLELVKTIKSETGVVPEFKTIVTSVGDAIFKTTFDNAVLYNIETWEPTPIAGWPTEPTSTTAYCPDRKLLAAGGELNIYVWETNKLNWTNPHILPFSYASDPSSMVWADYLLIVASYLGNMVMWDSRTWTCLRKLNTIDTAFSIAFVPELRVLLTAGYTGVIKVWGAEHFDLKMSSGSSTSDSGEK